MPCGMDKHITSHQAVNAMFGLDWAGGDRSGCMDNHTNNSHIYNPNAAHFFFLLGKNK